MSDVPAQTACGASREDERANDALGASDAPIAPHTPEETQTTGADAEADRGWFVLTNGALIFTTKDPEPALGAATHDDGEGLRTVPPRTDT